MSVYIDRTEVNTDKSPVVLWDNVFLTGTLAASSEAGDNVAENAVGENTYDFWTPSSLPATISITRGSAFSASYCGIAAHNLGTNGNTVAVEHSNNGSTWTEVASITPTDDTTILIAFEDTSATYFRLYISGGTAPDIGVLFMGEAIRFDTGILPAYTPLSYSENVELLMSQTMTGQFITNRVNRKSATNSFQLNILDRSFVEGADFQAFRRHYNDGKTFFFASNPTELDFDVGYCWRQDGGELRPTFEQNGIFYNTSMSLEAYIGN